MLSYNKAKFYRELNLDPNKNYTPMEIRAIVDQKNLEKFEQPLIEEIREEGIRLNMEANEKKVLGEFVEPEEKPMLKDTEDNDETSEIIKETKKSRKKKT